MEKEIQPVAKDPLVVFDAMEEARKSGDVPNFLHHVQILDQMLLPASGEFPKGIRATEVPRIRDHLRLLGKTPAIWTGAYDSLEEAVREDNPAAILERARLVEVLGIPNEAPEVGDYISKLRKKYTKPAEEPEIPVTENRGAADLLPNPFPDRTTTDLGKTTEEEIIERYQTRADEVGVKMPEGDFLPVDGQKIRSLLDEEGTVIPSHTEPEEVEQRLPFVGQYGGNDGAITFVGPDGRYWVGLQSKENFQALETAGFQKGGVDNIMNADCTFVDSQLQTRWEQWEKLLSHSPPGDIKTAESLIPPVVELGLPNPEVREIILDVGTILATGSEHNLLSKEATEQLLTAKKYLTAPQVDTYLRNNPHAILMADRNDYIHYSRPVLDVLYQAESSILKPLASFLNEDPLNILRIYPYPNKIYAFPFSLWSNWTTDIEDVQTNALRVLWPPERLRAALQNNPMIILQMRTRAVDDKVGVFPIELRETISEVAKTLTPEQVKTYLEKHPLEVAHLDYFSIYNWNFLSRALGRPIITLIKDEAKKLRFRPEGQVTEPLKPSETSVLEMYQTQAEEAGVQMPKGDFMSIDGREVRTSSDQKASLIPLHTEPEEIDQRLPRIGVFRGNNEVLIFVGPDGRYWVGPASPDNVQALTAAGYKTDPTGNIKNTGYTFADPKLQREWEQLLNRSAEKRFSIERQIMPPTLQKPKQEFWDSTERGSKFFNPHGQPVISFKSIGAGVQATVYLGKYQGSGDNDPWVVVKVSQEHKFNDELAIGESTGQLTQRLFGVNAINDAQAEYLFLSDLAKRGCTHIPRPHFYQPDFKSYFVMDLASGEKFNFEIGDIFPEKIAASGENTVEYRVNGNSLHWGFEEQIALEITHQLLETVETARMGGYRNKELAKALFWDGQRKRLTVIDWGIVTSADEKNLAWDINTVVRTLFTALVGSLPRQFNSSERFKLRGEEQREIIRRFISPGTQAILGKLLSPNEAERYYNLATLKADIEQQIQNLKPAKETSGGTTPTAT